MKRFARFSIWFLLFAPFLSAESSVWQPPPTIPMGCIRPQFRLLLLDISEAMNSAGRFDAAKARIFRSIDRAPTCSLVVVGSFGATADVLAGRFVTSSGSRSRLKGTVDAMRSTQNKANLEEAAKVIEWLSLRLRDTYGAAANELVVRVYSVPDPVGTHQQLSVGQMLARRMSAQYSRLTLEAGAAASPATAAGTSDQTGTGMPAGLDRPRPKRSWRRALVALAGGIGVVFAAWFLLVRVWLGARHSNPGESDIEALLVEESQTTGVSGDPPQVRPERRIEIALGVPAVFSTDVSAATYIAADIPGVPGGELFRVVPLTAGNVRVESSSAGLTINEAPIEGGQAVVSLWQPLRVGIGPRNFTVSAVRRRPHVLEAHGVFEAGIP